MRFRFFILFCIVSILFSNFSKMPLSHKSFNDNRPEEYERGIFLIVLANESLNTWLGSDSVGDDFLEFATPYVVDSQEIEGMVYTYINILSESIYNGSPELQGLNSVELGMRILSAWVEKYPQNQRLINKKNKFQSFINNY